MPPHPRLHTRDLAHRLPDLRVLAYAPNSPREDWIVRELTRVDALTQIARSAEHVVAALVEDPPPRPAVLVVDFDQMDGGEMLGLHAIREHGWCGVIVGVGLIPIPLRSSLGIEKVVELPAKDGAIANAVETIGFQAQTLRIPVRRDTAGVAAFQARAANVRVKASDR